MSDSLLVEKSRVIEACSAIFIHSDAHEWEKVKLSFDGSVLVAYSSRKFFRDKKEARL